MDRNSEQTSHQINWRRKIIQNIYPSKKRWLPSTYMYNIREGSGPTQCHEMWLIKGNLAWVPEAVRGFSWGRRQNFRLRMGQEFVQSSRQTGGARRWSLWRVARFEGDKVRVKLALDKRSGAGLLRKQKYHTCWRSWFIIEIGGAPRYWAKCLQCFPPDRRIHPTAFALLFPAPSIHPYGPNLTTQTCHP